MITGYREVNPRGRENRHATAGSENFACIYLLEDEAGDIIYIGRTTSWSARRWLHSKDKAWWPDVERVHCLLYVPTEAYDLRGMGEEMKRDEWHLIGMLQPRHNRQGLRKTA